MTPIHPTDLSLWPSHTTLFHISELLDILFLIPGICLYSLVFLEKKYYFFKTYFGYHLLSEVFPEISLSNVLPFILYMIILLCLLH